MGIYPARYGLSVVVDSGDGSGRLKHPMRRTMKAATEGTRILNPRRITVRSQSMTDPVT